MRRHEQLCRVLDVVYRAAIEPEVWPLALREISDALDSSVSGLLLRDKKSDSIPLVAMDPRSDLSALQEYIEYYAAIDDMRRVALLQPVSEVITDVGPQFAAITRRSECYNDFYCRKEMGHFIGGSIVNDDLCEGTLVVYRGGRALFSDEQIAIMEMLLPHMTRAVAIWSRVGHATASHRVLGTALDALSSGVVLLDAAGHVVWMNRTAREIVGANDGLSISGRSLRLASSAAELALRAMIATVTTRLAETKPLHVTVPRASGALPYLIVAAPIRGDESAAFPSTASVMLVVTDRARANRFTQHLVDIYALTPAETALASALADGYTLQEYAAEHAISIDTARAHLKRVMDKTNTHRQAELVNLILTSPAAVLRS